MEWDVSILFRNSGRCQVSAGGRVARDVVDDKCLTYLESLLVHWNLALETSQVEVILDELLRHLGEVLVAQKGAEGGDPGLPGGRIADGHCVACWLN